MKQHLKPIPGFDGYYADNRGDIWSAKPSRWGHVKWRKRKPGVGRDGYLDVVLLRSCGKKVNKPVHRLVALAFHGFRPANLVTTHLDGDKKNNTPSNLEYRSHYDNAMDKVIHGTMLRGQRNPNSKLTDEQAGEIVRLVNSGVAQTKVAQMFSVHPTTVWTIKTGKSRAFQNLDLIH